MRHLLIPTLFALALSACADGFDHVAEGTPVYDGGAIVRWTAAGEKFSANVQPGQPYVAAGRVELNRR